jgi:hypothetical protein
VAAAVGINLDLLDAERRARFSELGIFPEDVDVPVGIVARLWCATGGLDAFATGDLLSELFDLSLLLDLELERRWMRNSSILAGCKRSLPRQRARSRWPATTRNSDRARCRASSAARCG